MKILLFANTEWYLFNFRLALACALREAGYQVVLVSPPGPYGERLQKLGFRWIPAPMSRRSLNPVRELRLLLWLRKLIEAEDVDLVHGFTIKCAIYGAIAARFSGSRATVNAVAGMGYVFTSDELRARLLRPVVRALMRLALDANNSRLVLQNPEDVALFTRSGLVDPGRIRLIAGSGVDCKRFEGRGLSPETGDMRVLFAARILWDKGVGEFVEAARILKTQGRPLRFQLAGEPDPGNPASIPLTTIQDWEAEGVIDRLGHVEDMPALYSSVHIVVLPSYREGLPKTLIEAAASSLPIVTTDVPGCRDVVVHEVDGLLVPVRNASLLAQAIARLQDQPSLAARLGIAAHKKALREFDERMVIAKTLAVYAELIGSPGPV